MRSGRLLSILLLLQVNRRMTARELAERLEVSERTIHRDMEALSGAGVPVTADRGSKGGWRLLEGYRTDLTGLNRVETAALFLPQPAPLLNDLRLHQAAESALIRLVAALPTALRRDAEFVRQRIHVDGAGWREPGEDVALLPVLQEAIWQERQVRFTYERAEGTAVERLADPLGLVAKGRAWYLVAVVEGEIRTYRVSRVRSAEVTQQPGSRPADFDLAAWWAGSAAQFVANLPRFIARLVADADLLPRLRFSGRFARVLETGPPDAAGRVVVTMQFDTAAEACAYILGCGPRAEVIDPPELRAQVLEQARGVVALYG